MVVKLFKLLCLHSFPKFLMTSLMCPGPYAVNTVDGRTIWHEYKMGQTTHVDDRLLATKRYGLTCFETQELAFVFARNVARLLSNVRFGIYHCEAPRAWFPHPKVKRVLAAREPTRAQVDFIDTLMGKTTNVVIEHGEWPLGTVMVTQLKITGAVTSSSYKEEYES